ncbi:MAG: hypothetical protein AAF458_23325 [Pseudomonadota bacterium]
MFVIAIGAFQWFSMAAVLDTQSTYNLRGMWITIPDFADRIANSTNYFERIYLRLNGWDGHWYHHIARNDYQCTGIPSNSNPHICNVAFFPLVPFLGSAASQVGIDLVYALPLISQVAWLLTLLLILLFVRSIREFNALRISLLLLLVAYPGTLYASMAYSESVLTLLVVSVVVLSHRYLQYGGTVSIVALAACCYLLGLVKVTGITASAIPVLMALAFHGARGQLLTRQHGLMWLAAGLSLLGVLTFFLFAEIRFGRWDLYFQYTSQGWSGKAQGIPDLNPLSMFTNFHWHEHPSVRLSNAISIVLPLLIVALGVLAWRFSDDRQHLYVGILGAAAVMYYAYSVPGNYAALPNRNLMRHVFPVVALAVMAAMLLPVHRLTRIASALAGALTMTAVVLGLYFQTQMFQALKVGDWVS